MDRKLLPYEHQLVEALGVTKEEYLEFVAIQQEYRDPKAGTALDIRNDAGVTALVLTVVGVLFQVGAALLTPKPKIPSIPEQRNQARSREQRFAPTYGFNSAQELASYNDPVNLVYTNIAHNTNGGIRVSGSLVWSAIQSLGSGQFMQLLFIMGASKVRSIKPEYTAFGQVGLQDFDPALVWQFYKNNSGEAGPVKFDDIVFGYPSGKQNASIGEKLEFLPAPLKQGASGRNVCRVDSVEGLKRGFSQVYTPTTSTVFGAYDPIPINVKYFGRDEKGRDVDLTNGIHTRYDNRTQWPVNSQGQISENTTFLLQFDRIGSGIGDEDELGPVVENLRRQHIQGLNFGATYMLGTAKFILEAFETQQDIERGIVFARFRCIESGVPPFTNYFNNEMTDPNNPTYIPTRKELQGYLDILNADEEDPVNDTDAAKFQIPMLAELSGEPNVREDYVTRPSVLWYDERGKPKTTRLTVKGSIAFSKERAQKRAIVVDNPLREAKEERKYLKQRLADINQYIDDIAGGDYDEYRQFEKFLQKAKEGFKPEEKQITLTFPAYKDNNEVDNSKKRKTSAEWDTAVEKQQARLAKATRQNQSDEVIDGFATALKRAQYAARRAENKCTRLVRRFFIADARKNKPEKQPLVTGNITKQQFYTTDNIPVKGQVNWGGIAFIEELLSEVDPPDEIIKDLKGTDALYREYRNLIRDKKATRDALKKVIANYGRITKNLQQLKDKENRLFYTKCLVKADSASYETVSEVDHVKLAIKASLFRRISGRQRVYGEEDAPDGYRDFDNGVHNRTAFFRLAYKKVGDAHYKYFRNLFAMRRRSESDFYAQIDFQPSNTGASRTRWQFRLEPVIDLFAIDLNDCKVCMLGGTGKLSIWENTNRTGHRFSFYGFLDNGINKDNKYPNVIKEEPDYIFDVDMFANNSDNETQFSHERGPEFTLTSVTEQQFAESAVEKRAREYPELSTMAMIVRAGKGIQDLRNVTAFVTQGKDCFTVENFNAKQAASTSYAPDIFVDTAIDKLNGVGKYIPDNGNGVLDQDSLIRAKKFCQNNRLPTEAGGAIQLFMDGLIADLTAWREFWIANSAFSLLELVRKDGKEALVPALPTNNSGRAANDDGSPVSIQISGLFTTGNILEGSYKEEFLDYGPTTQDLIATVIYREVSQESVFAQRKTVEVRRKGASNEDAITETFDASAFVTQREQAIMIGKLLVNQRRFILRGVEFKTFPSKEPIEPGEFIYVDVGNTTWDSYSSGMIMQDGKLNAPLYDEIGNGSYTFLIYNSKSGENKTLNSVQVTNMVASSLSQYKGWMFVMGTPMVNKRVFRVTEVALDEDGEVTVKAMEYPVDSNMGAKIADFRSSNFDVR